MEDFGGVYFFTFVLILIGAFVFSMLMAVEHSLKTDKCEKENNVYECVLIAVPKEDEQ